MSHTILALLPYVMPAPLITAVARWLEPTRICGACNGFGNRTASPDDTETECGHCHGSGWTYRN